MSFDLTLSEYEPIGCCIGYAICPEGANGADLASGASMIRWALIAAIELGVILGIYFANFFRGCP